jgi:hypothetical protein
MGLFASIRGILPNVIQRDHRANAGGLTALFKGKLSGLFGWKSSFSSSGPIGKALAKVAQEKMGDERATLDLGIEMPFFNGETHASQDGGFLGIDLIRQVAKREQG